MFFEVDVKPLALRGAGFFGRSCDERGSDSFGPEMLGDHRVQDEGVNAAVPGNVDEGDQRAVFPCADPAEAMALKSCSPVGLSDWRAEAVGVAQVARSRSAVRRSSLTGSSQRGQQLGLRRPSTRRACQVAWASSWACSTAHTCGGSIGQALRDIVQAHAELMQFLCRLVRLMQQRGDVGLGCEVSLLLR